MRETESSQVQIGQLCISLAGHDRGKTYVVTDLSKDSSFAFLSDGCSRKVNNPKKKRLRHLQAMPVSVPEELRARLSGRARVYDHELIRALRVLESDKALLPHKEG